MLLPPNLVDSKFPLHLTELPPEDCRPSARGKFLFIGERKFYIRGVTYGPFRLDDHQLVRDIKDRVCAAVRECAGHPAILCYTIGNEIPASIVRWCGARRIERFLETVYRAAKAEDPEGLFSYVNYPSTEYLKLPFLDLICFNVYLERQERLDAYLARLQNLADDRPLVMAEIGLDSRRHGEQIQAASLDWQIRTVFANGCAGAFAFAWTDEWHRGGFDIEDWDFGLVTRERQPKQALFAVCEAF